MDDNRFSELILHKLNASLTEAEESELQSLLASDESYASRYRMLMEYWETKETDNSNSQRLFEQLSGKIRQQDVQEQDAKSSIFSRNRWLLVAAALLVFFVSVIVISKSGREATESELTVNNTAINGQISAGIKKVTLADGSVIKLNRNSSLAAIRMSGNSREVTLSGEGYFDIKRDAKRPFTIHTSKMDIRVLGTSFNVCAYPKEKQQQAVLIHGSIKVTLHNKARSVYYLKPNDKLTINTSKNFESSLREPNEKVILSRLKHYEADEAPAVVETAWMSNHLVFRDETFEVLANRLEIRYGTQIVFESEKAKALRFNGTFKTESLQDVLYVLSRTGSPFTFKIRNGKVYID
ncbi:FecR family protein [Mucilaginibacter sp. PAMB04168]|uniref:FecR family protein n=1 Tax=Mucilaginibacter sp. PAMB04168 TaxID=3138567 RepID=UPI0031F6B39B